MIQPKPTMLVIQGATVAGALGGSGGARTHRPRRGSRRRKNAHPPGRPEPMKGYPLVI